MLIPDNGIEFSFIPLYISTSFSLFLHIVEFFTFSREEILTRLILIVYASFDNHLDPFSTTVCFNCLFALAEKEEMNI